MLICRVGKVGMQVGLLVTNHGNTIGLWNRVFQGGCYNVLLHRCICHALALHISDRVRTQPMRGPDHALQNSYSMLLLRYLGLDTYLSRGERL